MLSTPAGASTPVLTPHPRHLGGAMHGMGGNGGGCRNRGGSGGKWRGGENGSGGAGQARAQKLECARESERAHLRASDYGGRGGNNGSDAGGFDDKVVGMLVASVLVLDSSRLEVVGVVRRTTTLILSRTWL